MIRFHKLEKGKKWVPWSVVLFCCLCGCMACSGSKEPGPAEDSSTITLASTPSAGAEPQPSVEPEAESRGPEQEAPPEEPDQTPVELESYFSAIEDAVTRIPRETFDPEAVVQKVGQDPARLFEWVRDETGLIFYSGCLRGPAGVLMDRLGNSLDRALLLHRLLLLAGKEARLAAGRLSPEKAKEVYQKTGGGNLARFNPPSGLSLPDPEGALEEMAQKYQLHRDELLRLLGQARKDRENEAREISAQVSEQSSALLDIVKSGRKGKAKKPGGEESNAPVDHWWVQWAKEGRWEDLDPTLPSLHPGETIADAETTYDPEDLEEGIHHTITIRAIAEQWTDGRLEERTILEHRIIPSELLGKTVVFRQLPTSWPTDKKLFAAPKPGESLRAAVIGQTQWKAALEIDRKDVVEAYFTARGEVTEEPQAGTKKETGGGAGGLFGALAGGEKKEERESASGEGQLTAEWLEYEFHSPGQPVRTVRREIFDLLGASARKEHKPAAPKLTKEQQVERNFKILGQTELLPLVSRLSPALIETVAAENMLLDREFFMSLQEKYDSRTPQDVLIALSELRFLRGELYGLALKRFEFSENAADAYLRSPNLFAFHSSLALDKQGELVGSEGLDIVANDVSVSPAAKGDAFAVQLQQGVLETVLEAREMSDTGPVINTAILFAESKAPKIDWLLIQDAEDPDWKSIDLPSDVRARIEEDLSAGFWAIAPARQVSVGGKPRSGWWRLNPDTGNVVGIGEKGMGQAMTQYATKVNVVLQLKTAFQIYGDIMRCLGAALSAPLRGNRPQNDELVIKCIWDTVCKNAHKAAKQLLTIEVNWTNIIISQTISWAVNKLCAALWDKGIKN